MFAALSSHSRSSSRSSLDEALGSLPRSKDSSVSSTAAGGGARAKPLLDYTVYMASLLPEQVAVSPAAASPVLQSPQSSPGQDKKVLHALFPFTLLTSSLGLQAFHLLSGVVLIVANGVRTV